MEPMTLRDVLGRIDQRPAVTDAVVAVLIAVFGWASIALGAESVPGDLPIPAALWVALVAAPLAWRRRAPVVVLALLTVGMVVFLVVGFPNALWFGNAWLLAAYSAGADGHGRWRDPVRLVSSVALVAAVAWALFGAEGPWLGSDPLVVNVLTLATNAVLVVAAWLFGDSSRVRRQREAELAERTRQLERERETNAQRAVLAERVRISRELHDVVAHHVALIGIQAGAARRVLPTQPDRAGEMLAAIETSSREAVRELHRLLGFLRRDTDNGSLDPQPSLDRLDALLAQVREAGLPVSLAVEGEVRPLPRAVDLSAYRIAQEALTNTLRHAGPATATVTLRYGERSLGLEVADNGGGQVAGRVTGGGTHNGILGMRERAALLGGELRAGRRDGGGYSVVATLPFDRVPS